MTVHQAKGLQFDIVVLPELEGRLKAPHPTGHRPPATDRADRAGLPAREEGFWAAAARRVSTNVRNLAAQSGHRILCLLYVALTRAVHALHLIVPPTGEKEKTFPQTFTGVLRSAAGRRTSAPTGGNRLRARQSGLVLPDRAGGRPRFAGRGGARAGKLKSRFAPPGPRRASCRRSR